MAAAWLLGLYLANMYVRAGSSKLDGDGSWAQAFAQRGYPPWCGVLIGGVEIIGGATLIVPWLAPYGAFVLCVMMAGAGGSLAHGQRWAEVGWVTIYAAGLTWIAYEWRWVRWDREAPADGL
ncbi:MAG: DoxX family protein [Gemmatimonadales bacterium]|nr:DoxX family protein [Gemmatimonadales bacterium]